MSAQPPSAPDAADPSWVTTGNASRRPLIAVHTWRREERQYERLSAAMAGMSIVSMLPPSPDAGTMPRRTEHWVDHHEAILRELPVEPPYQFVGWSYGGVVAVELARRLKAAGSAVSFVGMVDSARPRLLPLSTREYVWHHLGIAATFEDERQRRAYLKKRGLFLLYRRFPRLRRGVGTVLDRTGVRERREANPSQRPTDPLMKAVHTAYLNYRAPAVPFPVSLFVSDASVERTRDPTLRWSPWLHGGYDLASVPGEHFTMWNHEHVGALGEAVSCSLARAGDTALR